MSFVYKNRQFVQITNCFCSKSNFSSHLKFHLKCSSKNIQNKNGIETSWTELKRTKRNQTELNKIIKIATSSMNQNLTNSMEQNSTNSMIQQNINWIHSKWKSNPKTKKKVENSNWLDHIWDFKLNLKIFNNSMVFLSLNESI